MKKKKSKKVIWSIIGGSTILSTAVAMAILIAVLMIFDFFGTKLTKEKVQHNAEYADAYTQAVNKYLKDGYVPLQRLLYFHLEDDSLTLDALYTMNQNKEQKTAREISAVCEDQRVKNMVACTETNIADNKDYLEVSTGHFNLPLDKDFTITSFFNEERVIYGVSNVHGGWDLAAPAKTPVYSVCSGTVDKVTFTQNENVPYDQSGNNVGNLITIKCDEDYDETYYVIFAHLYPNSAKVIVGDKVNHWTQVAEVGTTGHSTGNHLHYQVENANREKLDGMQFIDFTLRSPNYHFEPTTPNTNFYENNEFIIQ